MVKTSLGLQRGTDASLNTHSTRARLSLVFFLAGLLALFIAVQFPAMRELFRTIAGFGYVGGLAAGIMYATAFTSSVATLILVQMPEALNPLVLAFIGALGALAYDLIVFSFVRQQTEHGRMESIRLMLHRHYRTEWLMKVVGFIILASPLPDELGVGLLGFIHVRSRTFIATSFVANFLGILLIVLVA